MRPNRIAYWGSTAAERAQEFPCDRLLANPDLVMFRAVDVSAPAEVTFRWLCQLRAAPYSYDWLDNLGRRSPQTLTAGLDDIAVGQRFQSVFALVAFESGRSLTMALSSRLMGRIACTYRADRLSAERSRIVVKVAVAVPPRAPLAALVRLLLPPGDLLMMRRQLLNLKRLAERTAGGCPPG